MNDVKHFDLTMMVISRDERWPPFENQLAAAGTKYYPRYPTELDTISLTRARESPRRLYN